MRLPVAKGREKVEDPRSADLDDGMRPDCQGPPAGPEADSCIDAYRCLTALPFANSAARQASKGPLQSAVGADYPAVRPRCHMNDEAFLASPQDHSLRPGAASDIGAVTAVRANGSQAPTPLSCVVRRRARQFVARSACTVVRVYLW